MSPRPVAFPRIPLFVLVLALAACSGCRRPSEAATPAAPPPAQPDPYATTLTEGDRAFAQRGLSGAGRTALAAAVAAYARATAVRPGDPAGELRLARAEAFRGLVEEEPARAQEAWRSSARAAERALRHLSPAWAEAIDRGDDPAAAAGRVEAPGAEALYLVAQGAMRSAQATGYAAVLAVKDAALAMASRAAELDERVDAAGPHRSLGAWRAALPVAAGGGAAAARAHFERARALAPDDLLARVAEAETLAVLLQDSARFDALLDEVKAFDLGAAPARAPENAVAKAKAEALRARRPRLF